MKAPLLSIFALLWAFTVTAQNPVTLIYENFNGPVYYNGTYDGTSELVNYSPVSPGSGGIYFLASTTNTTRSMRTVVNTTDYQDMEISWYERVYEGAVTRTFSYSIGTGLSITLVPATVAVSGTWAKMTVTLGAEANNKKDVRLQWDLTRAASAKGNANRFALDDLTVTGMFIDNIAPGVMGSLPVELASFKGQMRNGKAVLSWATASEKNNDKFVVERSQDGKTYSQTGEVKGSGSSAGKISYSYTDNAPAGGVNYYRLRQIDFDGSESFSSVIALEAAARGIEATVYPTVASSVVTISLAHATGATTVSVADATGRPVATFSNTTAQEIELPVQSLKSGVYFVRVTDGQSRQVQRFIKE